MPTFTLSISTTIHWQFARQPYYKCQLLNCQQYLHESAGLQTSCRPRTPEGICGLDT